MYRQRMRRETPTASDEEIEARVAAWLRRPSGEMGDRLGCHPRGRPRWNPLTPSSGKRLWIWTRAAAKT